MLFAGQGQQGQAGQDVQESASRGPGMAGSSKATLSRAKSSKGLDVTGGSSRVSSSRGGLDPIHKTSISATKLPTVTATVGR